MKIEKIEDETTETIGKLWTAHHLKKEFLSAVIPSALFKKLKARLQLCPQVKKNSAIVTSLKSKKKVFATFALRRSRKL